MTGPSPAETEKIVSKLRRDMTNIVLAGMPGSGKTTVGRELAALSGKPFVDLDAEIVKRAGKPIPDIFAQEGEGAFRDLETEVLKEACARGGQIIATGGGAVLREENRAAMRRTGRVYRLRRRLEDLPTEGRPSPKARGWRRWSGSGGRCTRRRRTGASGTTRARRRPPGGFGGIL